MSNITTLDPSTDLIPVFSGELNGQPTQLCDARTLHAFLGSDSRFNGWFKARLDRYKFLENQDYIGFTEKTAKPLGGRPNVEYHLTLDMAKELAMVENNARGREARRYFIAMEQRVLKQLAESARRPVRALARTSFECNITDAASLLSDLAEYAEYNVHGFPIGALMAWYAEVRGLLDLMMLGSDNMPPPVLKTSIRILHTRTVELEALLNIAYVSTQNGEATA